MKYTTIVLALMFCMLLTGCHGDENDKTNSDSSVTETITSVATSADDKNEDMTDSKDTANTERTTAKQDISDFSESDTALEDGGDYADQADIEIGDNTHAVTTAKTSENN